MQYLIENNISINLSKREIHHLYDGRIFNIGRNEAELLAYFILNRDVVLSKQTLIEEVWTSRGICVEQGSLMQSISVCRKALCDIGGDIIVTERGKGYRFTATVFQESDDTSTPIPPVSHDLEAVTKQDIKSTFFRCASLYALSIVIGYVGSYLTLQSEGSDQIQIVNHSKCVVTFPNSDVLDMTDVVQYSHKGLHLYLYDNGKSISLPAEYNGIECES